MWNKLSSISSEKLEVIFWSKFHISDFNPVNSVTAASPMF